MRKEQTKLDYENCPASLAGMFQFSMTRLITTTMATFLLVGCATPEDNALLGVALSGVAPFAATARGAASAAAMGNAIGGYANAQASQQQVTPNVPPPEPRKPTQLTTSEVTRMELMFNPEIQDGGRVFIGTVLDYSTEVQGVLLAGTKPNSPAQKAGLKSGDIVVELNGQKVRTVYDFTFALGEVKSPGPVRIVILRPQPPSR